MFKGLHIKKVCRLIVLAGMMGILTILSGCIGLVPLDLKSAGMMNVNTSDGSCRVWIYNSTLFSSGYWTGGVANGRANGEGTLVLYVDNKVKNIEFRGSMDFGYATGQGKVIMGAFDSYGDLVKPEMVYQGELSRGLPNGVGIMWLYDDKGNLNYILEGTFRDAAVTGKYFYTKDGKREVSETK